MSGVNDLSYSLGEEGQSNIESTRLIQNDSSAPTNNDVHSLHKESDYMWKPGVNRDADYSSERCEIWDTGNGQEPLIQTPSGTKLRVRRGNLRPWLGI